jgi:hypothetical protein
MPRKRTSPADPSAPPAPVAVHVIHPTAVYFPDQVRELLRLRATTLRREVREGRLRVCRRGGRHLITGRQLLTWIEAGELPAKAARPGPDAA